MRNVRFDLAWLLLSPFSLLVTLAIGVQLGCGSASAEPVMTDSRLGVRTVVTGLELPTSLAFIGTDDFLVLEKGTGRVLRIRDGQSLGAVLDLGVNNSSERGLLGIALHPGFPNPASVYLYWTCRSDAPPTDPFRPDVRECSDANLFTTDSGNLLEVPLLANRVDRFTWDGTQLTFDRNLIKLRAFQNDAAPDPPGQGDENQPPRGNHDAGVLAFGPDGKLYVMVGDLGRRGKLQNLPSGPTATGLGPTVPDDQFGGPDPDDAHFSGVILRLNDDGTTPSDNPFFQAGASIGGEVGRNVQKIFAYGIRNSFGMAFDPQSGNLWEEENGEDAFDELNLVEPGMNGGWIQFMGPASRIGEFRQIETTSLHGGEDFPNLQQLRWASQNIATTPAEAFSRLFVLPGSRYSDPEFSWKYVLAPAAIGFSGAGLGNNFNGDLFVGLAVPLPEGGPLFRLKLTGNRRKIAVDDPRLEDRVADNVTFDDLTESESLLIGTNFGIVTDIESGPNGNLFVVSLSDGAVYEIFRREKGDTVPVAVRNPDVSPSGSPTAHVHGGPAGDEATATWLKEWYSTHPIVGLRPASAAPVAVPAAATFTAAGTAFDADGNAATQVDTVHILVGESVQWTLSNGLHTVTNGTGSVDPAAGTLFDVPLDPAHPNFSFQFDQAGQYPFFCRPHEDFNMRGVVVVNSPVGVASTPVGSRPGFASEPAPNPTTGAIAFQLTVSKAGPVSVKVFDARGRIVAQPLSGQFDAGTYPAAWDGRMRNGAHAPQGVYYLRLDVPGFSGSRRIVLSE